MTNKILLGIAIIALILGVMFIVYGSWLYRTNPPFQQTSNRILDTPVGFAFGNSENLTQESTYFWLHLENIECKERTIEAELDMNFVCQEMKNPTPFYNEKSVFFLLQIPSDISDVKVDYHMRGRDPQFYGGYFQIINSTFLHSGLSAILVEIPKENFTFGKSEFLCFYFKMTNVFSKVNSYTYQRVITFSSNFDDAVRNSIWQKHIVADNTAVFRLLYAAELYVEEPFDFNSQMLPLPRGIHYYSNHTQYSWNIKTIATSFGSDSVVIDFEDIPTKNTIATNENWMLFCWGLGIPLVVTALLEIPREIASLKSASHENSLNMPTPEQPKKFDRELELEKIHVVKETFRNYFKIGTSILTGTFSTLLVLIITLFFSQKLDMFSAILETIFLAIVISLAFLWVHLRNVKFLKQYDEWIKKIEKGESLPSITDMEIKT